MQDNHRDRLLHSMITRKGIQNRAMIEVIEDCLGRSIAGFRLILTFRMVVIVPKNVLRAPFIFRAVLQNFRKL